MQGALADKNSSLSKDELLHMVKFGADEIMQATGTTFTDEDIDIILQRGESLLHAERLPRLPRLTPWVPVP